MQHFELKGQIRQVGNKAVIKAFRKEGLVPCNLYGGGMENVLFTVSARDLKGVTDTPKSFIVDLVLDGKTYPAVLHELQFHPVKDNCLHVDFLAVDEKKPIYIDVMNNMSVDCDCDGNPASPKLKDIGILASIDPVAVDQACLDLVFNYTNSSGDDATDLQKRINRQHGTWITEYAESIGLGSRKYNIVNIDNL